MEEKSPAFSGHIFWPHKAGLILARRRRGLVFLKTRPMTPWASNPPFWFKSGLYGIRTWSYFLASTRRGKVK